MREWWQARAPRERAILLAAGVMLAAMLYFLMIWEPLQNAVQRLQADKQQVYELNSWLQGIAPELKQLRRNQGQPARSSSGSVLAIADSSAKAGGLGDAVKRMQPDGDNSVRVWLENASFNTLLAWLHKLEQQYAIRASDLNISRDNQAGHVKARMTLER